MVKRFVVLRRRRDMTVEEFRAYWRDVHGPLIGKIPGLRKYVQYHVRSEAPDEYRAVLDDEPNLFEPTSYSVHPVMTEETVVIV